LLHRLPAQDYSSGTTLLAESYPRYFRALEEHLVLPADDAWSDPRTSEYRDGYLAPNGIGAMMDVPVWLHGRVCGIVCHEHVDGNRPWRFGEQLFAAAVANFVSLALETREAARAAAEAEARCRDIFQRLPLGVYRSTRQGRLLFANPATAELLGFTDVEALKRIDSAESLYVDPEERARWIAQVEQTDVVMGLEMRFRRRDGAIVWVRNSARAVRDASGRMTHFEGALEDIDEWKRAQSKLAAEHATTRVLADSPRLGDAAPFILKAICESLECEWGAFWLVDGARSKLELLAAWSSPGCDLGEFEAVTRAATFAVGVGLPGRVWAAATPLLVRDVALDPAFRRREVAARSGLHGAFAFPVWVGDETIGVVEILSREIREPDSTLLLMARTIGNQLALFVQRQRATEALEEALARAQQSDRLKSAFLANTSHEIRTPVNVILGNVELLRGDLPEEDPRQPYLAAICKASGRLVTTLQGLIDVARLESAAFDYRPKPIRLAQMLRDCTRRFEPSMREKGLGLTLEVEDAGAVVSFDEYCLTRTLDQLVDNAVKFTAAGAIAIRLRCDPDRTTVVEVSDTGVGIDPSYLAHLFQPFSQEQSGYTRRFEGSGLGLALVRRFMSLGGAEVTVDSVKGKGSTFRLRFARSVDG
jgi:PAS domain S-box-containing protein